MNEKSDVSREYETALSAYYREDWSLAKSIFLKLAEEQDANSEFNLGRMAYYGLGGEKNVEEAVRWFERSIGRGHLSAYHLLAEIYLQGELGEVDLSRAVTYLEEGAEKGSFSSQEMLGTAYAEGRLGLERDLDRAIELFRGVFDHGKFEVGYSLAKALHEKGADSASMAEMSRCLVVAMDNGEPRASEWVRSEGAELFRGGADAGDLLSLYYLGVCYVRGWGAGVDVKEARKYLSMAADRGYVMAHVALGQLYAQGLLGKEGGRQAEEHFSEVIRMTAERQAEPEAGAAR
ncbi:tetratricopeptide repeat protein [Endothiovibrio diazotrophicus]